MFGTGWKVGVNEVGENSAHLGDVYVSRKSCLLSFKSQATRVAPGMMEGGFLKREPLLAGGEICAVRLKVAIHHQAGRAFHAGFLRVL